MHVDVMNSVVINRPIDEVSQYAADPDNAPQWYDAHLRAGQLFGEVSYRMQRK